MSWTVNADMRFLAAQHGEVIRDFDPVFYAGETHAWSGPALPEEQGLDWDRPRSAALTLQSRLTGLRIPSRQWLYENSSLAVGYT